MSVYTHIQSIIFPLNFININSMGAFFVKKFEPTTEFRQYSLNACLMHWQCQTLSLHSLFVHRIASTSTAACRTATEKKTFKNLLLLNVCSLFVRLSIMKTFTFLNLCNNIGFFFEIIVLSMLYNVCMCAVPCCVRVQY